MKKYTCLFLLSCIIWQTWALDGANELRALKTFDTFVARYVEQVPQKEQKNILDDKISSLEKQLQKTTNTARKELYTYLAHLFCEKRSLTNGVVCQDHFYTSDELTKDRSTMGIREMRRIITAEHSERRQRQGLTSLKHTRSLDLIAQAYADKLCEAGYITHELNGSKLEDRFQAGGYTYEWAGENLALGQKTIGSLMDQLTTSIHHRENIYRPEFREIGIGQCDNIWVINYGTPYTK